MERGHGDEGLSAVVFPVVVKGKAGRGVSGDGVTKGMLLKRAAFEFCLAMLVVASFWELILIPPATPIPPTHRPPAVAATAQAR